MDSEPLIIHENGSKKPTCALHSSCFLSDGAAKHSKNKQLVQKKLVLACFLTFLFMVGEFVGGYYAVSIAVMADAAHMLSDVCGFAVSIFATWMSMQKSGAEYTFGYHRAEIMGALVSIIIIWAVTGALVVEAVKRCITPETVNGKLMFIIAMAGIGFNLIVYFVLGHAHAGHECSHGHGHGHGDPGHGDHDHDDNDDHSHCGHGHLGHDDDHSSHKQISRSASQSHTHTPVMQSPAVKGKSCCNHDHGSHEQAKHEHDAHEHESAEKGIHKCSGHKHSASEKGILKSSLRKHGEHSHEHGSPSKSTHKCSGHEHKGHGADEIPGEKGVTKCSSHKHEGHDHSHGGAEHDSLKKGPAEGASLMHAHAGDEQASSRDMHVHSHDDHACTGHSHGHEHDAEHEHHHGIETDPTQPLLLQQVSGVTLDGISLTQAGGSVAVEGSIPACVVITMPPEAVRGLILPSEIRSPSLTSIPPPLLPTGSIHEHSHHGADLRLPLGGLAQGAHEGHSCAGHNHDHDDSHGHDHGESINLRASIVHVMGDLLQSCGVAIAGALIWWHQDDPRWSYVDPACTFFFSILVMLTTRVIILDLFQTLMERTPKTLNIQDMSQSMHQVVGVLDVHDLHVWNLSVGLPICTAHVNINRDADPVKVLTQMEAYLRTLGIKHSTIQICNPQGVVLMTSTVPSPRPSVSGALAL